MPQEIPNNFNVSWKEGIIQDKHCSFVREMDLLVSSSDGNFQRTGFNSHSERESQEVAWTVACWKHQMLHQMLIDVSRAPKLKKCHIERIWFVIHFGKARLNFWFECYGFNIIGSGEYTLSLRNNWNKYKYYHNVRYTVVIQFYMEWRW